MFFLGATAHHSSSQLEILSWKFLAGNSQLETLSWKFSAGNSQLTLSKQSIKALATRWKFSAGNCCFAVTIKTLCFF
jgi:hypothetical protein